MDRMTISHLAHATHPIAAPLSDGAVQALLQAALPGARSVLDLGCGSGEWLLRALRLDPGVTAVGVDLSDLGFDSVRALAEADGTADRLVLIEGDARSWRGPDRFDVVMCVGSTHAFGGLTATLGALEAHAHPDGVLLVGEGIWDRRPGEGVLEVLDATPEEFGDLAATVAAFADRGWVPLHGHVSTLEEWDDYEWAWTGALVRWVRENPDHPDRAQVLAAAAEHREMWLQGYRGTLGFATIVVGRAAG